MMILESLTMLFNYYNFSMILAVRRYEKLFES